MPIPHALPQLVVMKDPALLLVTVVIWIYWVIVGVMSWRVRQRTKKLRGVVPEQRIEQVMGFVWVPMVIAWMALPILASTHATGILAVASWMRDSPWLSALRWLGALGALACLAGSIECWKRMGRSWRMAVMPGEKTELITGGMYRLVRHPIYALSAGLVLCCAIVVANLPMAAVALLNLTLLNLKARNEERHMLATHGAAYAAYLGRTGRFVPRMRRAGA